MAPEQQASIKRVSSPEERLVYESFRDKIEAGTCNIQELRVARKTGIISVEQFASLASLLAERLAARLERQKVTDELTELLNQKLLYSKLGKTIEKLNSKEESNKPQGKRMEAAIFLYLDIENMKALNDEHDHSVGTKAILTVADRLGKAVKGKRDEIFHLHGDEFAAILEVNNANQLTLISIVERIENEINDNLSAEYQGEHIPFKVTVGCKVIEKGDKTTAENLVAMADRNMQSKKDPNKKRGKVQAS
jgi:diguanylate cyclase (GGDEF)-like protein